MLFKVQYQGKKRYVKLNGASYAAFLTQAKEKFSISNETSVYLMDETGTEIDEEVFSDVLEEKPDITWTIVEASAVNESPLESSCTDTLSLTSTSLSDDGEALFMSPKRRRTDCTHLMSPGRDSSEDSSSQAKELVKQLLESKPGGEKILSEYRKTKEVKDPLRRKLVNIIVAAMTEKYGRAPPMDVRTRYALGIVTLFPCLRDPYSQKGYEHFFDAQSNEGYIAWKLKNIQRELSGGSRRNISNSGPSSSRGPEFAREVSAEHQLEGDHCREAISLLKHSTDAEQILTKMEKTFHYRQKLINDSESSSTVLDVFPRFLDTKGLVLQDFRLLFGEEISSKLMEKWGAFLKQKVIKEARNLTRTAMLDSLLGAAEENPVEDEELPAWDSDMAALLLLVYLLPPPPSKKKSSVKITVKEALGHVVKFHKSCRSLQGITRSDHGRQPYILAVGTSRNSIHDYYIVLDGQLIPCKAKSSLPAFDELFKTHYVFGISYDPALSNMYTFVQTTIYNIDIGLCHESPRVKDLRAKLLN